MARSSPMPIRLRAALVLHAMRRFNTCSTYRCKRARWGGAPEAGIATQPRYGIRPTYL